MNLLLHLGTTLLNLRKHLFITIIPHNKNNIGIGVITLLVRHSALAYFKLLVAIVPDDEYDVSIGIVALLDLILLELLVAVVPDDKDNVRVVFLTLLDRA